MKLLALILTLLLVACSPLKTATEASESQLDSMPRGEYSVLGDGVTYIDAVEGYIAEPQGLPDAPGVILIHEWWGLNEHMETTAERIASHGYRVLAVDLYEGNVATTVDEARAFRLEVKQERAIEHLTAANAFLRERGSMKTASWGYCFGGGQSATFALEGETDATVVYYGSLADPLARPEAMTTPTLLIFGSNDTTTTLASAEELKGILAAQSTPVSLYAYEGRGHAFANPSNPGHDVADTRDAWTKTLAFLRENLN